MSACIFASWKRILPAIRAVFFPGCSFWARRVKRLQSGDEESVEVLRVAAEAAAPEKVLIAGVGRESVKSTVELAEAAAKFKYDAVLVKAPTYYATQLTRCRPFCSSFRRSRTDRHCL